MKSFDVIPQLHREVRLTVRSHCLQYLAVIQNIDLLIFFLSKPAPLEYPKADGKGIGQDQQIAEQLDVPEGGIYRFELCKHRLKN